jgi:hypothetical protein
MGPTKWSPPTGLRDLDHGLFQGRGNSLQWADDPRRRPGNFIAMKRFAGGPRDLGDARIALKSVEPLDLDLLRGVARRFGRSTADALESLMA